MPDVKKSTADPNVRDPVIKPVVNETPPVTRTPADQPAEKVKEPTVAEVKSNEAMGTEANKVLEKNITDTVAKTADSVAALNKTNADVAAAKPFVKPEVETVKADTPDEAIAKRVEATAASTRAFNESTAIEKKSTAQIAEEMGAPKPEVSRVAPLTGELRPDPADDSFVTPGKVLKAPDPKPGEPVPVVEEPPLVIAPLTGEIKRADEISYPTPGHGRDTSLAHKALEAHGDTFMIDSKKTKFGVAEGQQVSLLAANEEAWKNDALRQEDDNAMGASIADVLRRNRRLQKNLRA